MYSQVKPKLNSSKHRVIKLSGTTYYAFKISQLPKRFGITDEQSENTTGIGKKTPIKSWLNWNGFILIDEDLVTPKDLQHVRF